MMLQTLLITERVGILKTKVFEIRREKQISQDKLAEAVGVNLQTIESIEEGKYTASLVIAHKISKYFGLTIEEVFDFSDLDELSQFRTRYEKKLKIANVLFFLGTFAFIADIISVFIISDEMVEFINKWGIDIQVPILSGFSLGFWSKCRNVLNSETALEKAFLKEMDERLVNIRTKSNLWASYIMNYLICILSIILRNYDKMISYLLLGILFIGFIVEIIGRKLLSKKL